MVFKRYNIGKKVLSLEYEAYAEMAIIELKKLCCKVSFFKISSGLFLTAVDTIHQYYVI